MGLSLLPLAAVAAAFLLTLLGAGRSGDHAEASATPSFLVGALGEATPRAAPIRTPKQGVTVEIDQGGYRVERGQVALGLSGSETGVWQPHEGGAVRATSFGSETVTVGSDRTELFALVTKRQGIKTWRWLLETRSLAPSLDADGAVTLTATGAGRNLSIAPVKILTPSGKDVTPARASWSLRPDPHGTWLELRLDDAGLPLPYVIDPATDYPDPLYFSTANASNTTTTNDWRLLTTPVTPHRPTSTRIALRTTAYAPFRPAVASNVITASASTTPTTAGWIVDVTPGSTGFVAGNWTFTLKSTNGGTNGGAARYTVAMWRGTLSGTAPSQTFGCTNCSTQYTRAELTGDLLVPPTDGTANILATTPATDTVTVAVPAFKLTANQTIWVQVWNHQVAGYTTGSTSARTVQLVVNDGTSQIVHPAADDIAPSATARTATGSTLIVSYGDTLDTDASSKPATGDYAVLVNGASRAVSTVAVAGTNVTLTLASTVQNRDVVTVAYTQGINILKDDAMNTAASFTAAAVTNSTPNAVPNTPTSLSPADAVRYSSLTPSFSGVFSDPDAQSTGAVNFRVCDDAACSSIRSTFDSPSGLASGTTGNAIYAGPALVDGTTYYWQSKATDQDGGSSDWTPATPRSFVPDVSAPTVITLTVTGRALAIAYDEALAGAPVAGDYTVTVDGAGRAVSNVVVGGADVYLTLSTAARSGQVVTVAYAGAALTDLAEPTANQAATFGPSAVTNATGNVAPNSPTALGPADAVKLNTLTPSFSGGFSDDDGHDTGTVSFRICDDVACSSVRSSFSSSAGLADGATGSASYSGPALQSGTTYYWQARNEDSSGATSAWTPDSPRSFLVDTAEPSSVVTFPADGGAYNAAGWGGTLSGTATDTGGAGIASVDLSIQRVAGGLYWDPAADSFSSAAPVWFAAADTTSWSYGFPAASLPADGSYVVSSRATDSATNVQSPVTNATFTFAFDAPGVTARGVDGSTLTIDYDEPVGGSPATGDYTVIVNGASRTVSNVVVSGSSVVLTLASGVRNGDGVTVAYAGGAVRDSSGNAAPSFGASPATNRTANQPPSPPAPTDAFRYDSTTPVFSGRFIDADTQNTGRIVFRVCDDAACSTIRSTFTSAAGLANGSTDTATYTGAALATGATYWWQALNEDEYGARSAWTPAVAVVISTKFAQATQLIRIASAKRVWLAQRHFVAVHVQLSVPSTVTTILVDPQGRTTAVSWTTQNVRAGATILRLPIPRTLRLLAGEYKLQLRATSPARGTTVGRTAKLRLLEARPPTPFTPRSRPVGVVLVKSTEIPTLTLDQRFSVRVFAASEAFWATGVSALFVEAVVVDLDEQNVALVRGLRQVFPELRILVVTKSEARGAEARRAGATLVVLKPASRAFVSARLRTLISR